MADNKQTDAPDKKEQAVVGGDQPPQGDAVNAPTLDDKTKAPAPEKSPGKQAPPAPGKEAPAAGGKDEKVAAPPAPGKNRIIGVDFPSGKSVRIEDKPKTPDKAAPAPNGPGGDKQAGPELTTEGDSLDSWNKEQAALDAKKSGRKPRAAAKPDQPDKPPAKRGRPKKEQAAPAQPKPPAKSGDAISGKDYRPDFPPTPPPSMQTEAPRPKEPEQIVHLNISELYAFKDHPFGVRDDKEMRALVESVKDKGVNSPALVRPREGGGYEIVAGHRRQRASELAGFKDMPCIVRQMTDDEAILAMTDDNLRQRSEILPSEKAHSLKMQVDAINHRGERNPKAVPEADRGKKSIQIVGERNDMTGKQVQRYVRLTELVPDLLAAVDDKKLSFTPALEFSFIKPKNQRLIAVNLDGEQASPSLSQAKQLRELDQKGQLNGDVIDSILSQEKKEVEKVILSGDELSKYFGNEKTPRQMKDKIIELLEDMKAKEKAVAPPDKKIKAPEK
ncbi:MAG: ParB/RepB/Spo0J family partition protein [Oscillospiraceae bacterium]|nr:ParB/RepB/Spo0J family partition protein [Oscillospiraceae bacterium]